MLFSKPLFGATIPPACEYCEYGRPSRDGRQYYCPKRGIMPPSGHCRAYSYDPLRRVPKRRPPMPQFSPDDFKL